MQSAALFLSIRQKLFRPLLQELEKERGGHPRSAEVADQGGKGLRFRATAYPVSDSSSRPGFLVSLIRFSIFRATLGLVNDEEERKDEGNKEISVAKYREN